MSSDEHASSVSVVSSVAPSPDRYIVNKNRKNSSMLIKCLEKNMFIKENVIPEITIIKTKYGIQVVKNIVKYRIESDDL